MVHLHRVVTLLVIVAVLVAAGGQGTITAASRAAAGQGAAPRLSAVGLGSCSVTAQVSDAPPDPETASWSPLWYVNAAHTIWAASTPGMLWYAGVDQKILWYRPGSRLVITAHRLNGAEGTVRASGPGGYEGSVYQASGVTISKSGCWSITGTAGKQSLTFVVRVYPHRYRPAAFSAATFRDQVCRSPVLVLASMGTATPLVPGIAVARMKVRRVWRGEVRRGQTLRVLLDATPQGGVRPPLQKGGRYVLALQRRGTSLWRVRDHAGVVKGGRVSELEPLADPHIWQWHGERLGRISSQLKHC